MKHTLRSSGITACMGGKWIRQTGANIITIRISHDLLWHHGSTHLVCVIRKPICVLPPQTIDYLLLELNP